MALRFVDLLLVTVSMGVPIQAIWAVAGRVSRGQWVAGGVANSAISFPS